MTFTFKSLATAALLVSLVGCNCETQTRKRFPKIEVLDDVGNARTNVDFGKVQLNFTATKKVRIRNAGAAALTLEKAVFTKALFGLGQTVPVSLGVNEELELPLTFTPTAADRFAAGAIAGTRFGTGAITDAKVATNAVTGAKVGADLTRADLSAVVGEAKVAGKAIFSATAVGCDGAPFLSTKSSCDTRTCPLTLPNGIGVIGRVGCDGTGCGQFATTCNNTRLGVLVAP